MRGVRLAIALCVLAELICCGDSSNCHPDVVPQVKYAWRYRQHAPEAHTSFPPRGQPCATSGPEFQPDHEAWMECTVGTKGDFYNYNFATSSCCQPGLYTLHGLWPNYAPGTEGYQWPQYCDAEKFDMDKIKEAPGGLYDRMNTYWKSCPPHGLDGKTQEEANAWFWQHEWDRHGSCSGYSLLDFFNFGLDTLNNMQPEVAKACEKDCADCTKMCGCETLDVPRGVVGIGAREGESFPHDLEGLWRSFGAEDHASGKYEFDQLLTSSKNNIVITADGGFPAQTCEPVTTYGAENNVALFRCAPNGQSQFCIQKILPGFDSVDVAFFSCNHSGWPAPSSFDVGMDGAGSGNFFMVRCKAPECHFTQIQVGEKEERKEVSYGGSVEATNCGSGTGEAGVPSSLLGSWRTLQISNGYDVGVPRWNFSSDNSATMDWPNYPGRSTMTYDITSNSETSVFLKNRATGGVLSCAVELINNNILDYGLLYCGPEGGPVPANAVAGLSAPNVQYAITRCNPNSPFCQWSCNPDNDNCGTSIDGTTRWCQKSEPCWPTPEEVAELRANLHPEDKINVNWAGFPEAQPSALPYDSDYHQSLYGLGNNATEIDVLYENPDLDICFEDGNPNNASDHCKAATRNQPYNRWTPAFIAFVKTKDDVRVALEFAVKHELCVMVASTGHEYLNRHSCPTGGMMIRTTGMQQREFLPVWEKNPAAFPDGVFRLGPGGTWSTTHKFAANNNRVVSSGWCSTVGLIGFSVGGGHGPLAPSLGLGVDNTVQFTMLQVAEGENGEKEVRELTVNEFENKDLFWAMKGGGGSTWGIVTEVVIRAHPIPKGGFTEVNVSTTGTFCHNTEKGPHNFAFLKNMWHKYAEWQLTLDEKFSVQTSLWPAKPDDNPCDFTWTVIMTYYYYGPENEPAQQRARNAIVNLMDPQKGDDNKVQSWPTFWDSLPYIPVTNFQIRPHPADPTNYTNTGAQSSALISRDMMKNGWATVMGEILELCPLKGQCGFHFLYLSFTGNLGSKHPSDTSLSPAMRSSLMAHNARGLSEEELKDTLYKLSDYSYFSESAFWMKNWGERYWGAENYEKLVLIKEKYDPYNIFWCHHCVGDNPDNNN